MMDLDRGALARIDRQLLASLDHDQRSRMVRVPISDAVWATWRRYCAAVNVSMGKAIAVLIAHELQVVVASTTGDSRPIFGAELEERLRRSEELDERQRRLEQGGRLIRQVEQRLRAATSPYRSPVSKPSRNEACPCGSGLKYKRCHGS